MSEWWMNVGDNNILEWAKTLAKILGFILYLSFYPIVSREQPDFFFPLSEPTY